MPAATTATPNDSPNGFAASRGTPYEPGFDLTLRPKRVDQPRTWRRPRLIFVNSMSDLFHEDVPWNYIGRVFDTMETADRHIYQVLTKRSSRMRNFVNERYPAQPTPPHIWLGTSIENARTLGRLRHLKRTNASLRFLSLEPLLGPLGALDLAGIHWVIAGGESGPGAPAGFARNGCARSATPAAHRPSRSSSSSGADAPRRPAATSWMAANGLSTRTPPMSTA